MMSILKKIVLFPFLYLCFSGSDGEVAANLSSYVIAPLMLYSLRLRHLHCLPPDLDQFFILLVAEFICFVSFSVQQPSPRASGVSVSGLPNCKK